MFSAESIVRDLKEIRARAPLIHNITNYVVMNLTANALLALGASPVMAHAAEEVEDMTGLASGLVINIGTLSPTWVEAMFKAGQAAARRNIPVVLDPVGAGATPFRTSTARKLLESFPVAIVRGNGSEIKALVESEARTKGVDSLEGSESAVLAAGQLVKKFGCVVSISGEKDFIVGRDKIIIIKNGHPLMPRVTGLGCTASALTAAFAAVNSDYTEAAAAAMAVMGICGELAASRAAGPASFELNFIDWLYNLTGEEVEDRLRFEIRD